MKKYLGVLIDHENLDKLLLAIATVPTAEVSTIKNAITDYEAAAAGHRGRIAARNLHKNGGSQ